MPLVPERCLLGCGLMGFSRKPFLWVAPFVVACSASVLFATVEPEWNGLFDRENVMVLVRTYDGWGGDATTGLSCDGRIQIIGVYADTTRVRGVVSPDSALVVVNELMALNFFEQPEEFGATQYKLVTDSEGRLGYRWGRALDSGFAEITLRVGTMNHDVTLRYPAVGAPKGLHRWLQRFKEFIELAVND
jgi:hypothetical protein